MADPGGPSRRTAFEFDFFAEEERPNAERPKAAADHALSDQKPDPEGQRRGLDVPRLSILALVAIVLAVILTFWITSGGENTKEAEYARYFEGVGAAASESEAVGQALRALITTRGVTLEEIGTSLQSLRMRQAQTVAEVELHEPPIALREAHRSLLSALQFRVSGLDGLAQLVRDLAELEDGETAPLLVAQSQRLLASDVIYDDLFVRRSRAILEREGIAGVSIADSNFLQEGETDLVEESSWRSIVERLTRSPVAAGLHGNELLAVNVRPGNQTLSADEENTIRASDRLVFRVFVKNSGDNQETQVAVTLSLEGGEQPISDEETIEIINPGDTKIAIFRDLEIGGSIGERRTLRVSVEAVPEEANLSNNSADYAVIFTVE